MRPGPGRPAPTARRTDLRSTGPAPAVPPPVPRRRTPRESHRVPRHAPRHPSVYLASVAGSRARR
ncbi:hypothetical protein B9W64_22735 [Streptomyces sp. CS159]|nr:hypothetical protein B9W64_22735 [Streptomyces sp. CS159]